MIAKPSPIPTQKRIIDPYALTAQINRIRTVAGAGMFRPPFDVDLIAHAALEGEDVVITGSDNLPARVHEAVRVDRNGHATIIYQRSLPVGERRVAIVHAVAHLLWDMSENQWICATGITTDHFRELRADMFAEEMLVPLAELCDMLGHLLEMPEFLADMVDRAQERFGVPRFLVERRVKFLRHYATMGYVL